MSSVSHRGFTHLGLDVAKDSMAVAVLAPDRDRAPVEKIFHDEVSVRRLIDRFDDRSTLWACYEAGPTGYVKRPGFAGGSDPTERWADASTEEVSAGAARARGAARGRGAPSKIRSCR